jgi:signal peptidase I
MKKEKNPKKSSSKFLDGLKKVWNFIWNDDSVLSWIVNIILAYLIIKFILYPLMGLIFGSSFPIVAVVSSSMEHTSSFDSWWDANQEFYMKYNITKEEFESFDFKNGFNKGDIMLLSGKDPEKIEVGDTIVFQAGKAYPIIHRVIRIYEEDGELFFHTKGDNNPESIVEYRNFKGQMVPKGTLGATKILDETAVSTDVLLGKAFMKVPWLGYIKIWFVDLLNFLGLGSVVTPLIN